MSRCPLGRGLLFSRRDCRRAFWTISFGISWTYAFLSSLSAGQPKRYCSSRPVCRNRALGWASLATPGYGYKEFHAPPHCSLNARPGRNDEQQEYSRYGGNAGAGSFAPASTAAVPAVLNPTMGACIERQWQGIRRPRITIGISIGAAVNSSRRNGTTPTGIRIRKQRRAIGRAGCCRVPIQASIVSVTGLRSMRRWLAADRWLKRLAIVVGALAVIFVGCFGALWWRLGAGPINLDIATPWLAAAIEDNIGHGNTVEVGGTQIERAGRIRIAVRIRDIVVRDHDHAIVATAPKAEVKLSGAGLLMGHLRAESLNLVDAELAIRIAPDGTVTVSAGDTAKPLATGVASKKEAGLPPTFPRNGVPPPPFATGPASPDASQAAPQAAAPSGILQGLDWLDSLSMTGLDGQNLNEIGLKNGNLIVDDQQRGSKWSVREHHAQPAPAEPWRRRAQPRRGGRAPVVAARHDRPCREWRALGRHPRRQGLDRQHPAGAAGEGLHLHRRPAADRRAQGRARPRRRADLLPRQDRGRCGQHHRHRHARLSDGDRLGRDQRRVGFEPAGTGRSVQDPLGREPPDASGPSRAAQRHHQRLAARLQRRLDPAGRHRQRAAAGLQPHRDRLPLRHRPQAHAADAGRYQQWRDRRRRHRRHRLFGRAAADAGLCGNADVGLRAQADVADARRSRVARMGDRADRARHAPAHRDRRQFADEEPPAQGPAHSRRRPVGQHRRERRRGPPRGWHAGGARCRSEGARDRAHRDREYRAGHCRYAGGPQGHDLRLRLRGAGYGAQAVAIADQVPRRGPGAGGRRNPLQ